MCHHSVLPLYPCSKASTILSHSRHTMHICLMNRVGRQLKGEQSSVRVQIQALPFTSSEIWGKLLNLSVPVFLTVKQKR